VEVLAAVMLVGIILPATMRGISVASQTASAARHRNEASALGQSKLDEIVATREYLTNSNMSGDFGADWPGYQWSVQIQDWSPNGTAPTNFTGTLVQELDMHVTWTDRSRNQEMVLTTLVYDSPNAGNATSN
jgi:Tfp pilus assembly protein PilV